MFSSIRTYIQIQTILNFINDSLKYTFSLKHYGPISNLCDLNPVVAYINNTVYIGAYSLRNMQWKPQRMRYCSRGINRVTGCRFWINRSIGRGTRWLTAPYREANSIKFCTEFDLFWSLHRCGAFDVGDLLRVPMNLARAERTFLFIKLYASARLPFTISSYCAIEIYL